MNWEQEYSKSLRTAQDLHENGFIHLSEIPSYDRVIKKYDFILPRYYASLIDKGDPFCPIRLQALPSLYELDEDTLSEDPLKDLQHRPAPRITHRYRGRALLHLTPNCSMYCRYCFRKSLLNELKTDLFQGGLGEAFAYLSVHSEIEEVILSGGDPLLVTDHALQTILDKFSAIPHLKRIRLHTRVPVTLPERITQSLANTLRDSKLPIVTVVHFNHPKELTVQSQEACDRLRKASAFVLNQSVLLKGVNDHAQTLSELSQKLFSFGILPYYLHHPDPAKGTLYFLVTRERGNEIYKELKASLPGYLVPRYVIDIVGEPYKRSAEDLP